MLCDELRRPRSKATLSSVASCELCKKTSHTWIFAIDDGVFEVPDYRGTEAKRFGCRYQAEAQIRTDRMSNSGVRWNHFDMEAIARDSGLHYPIPNAMSRTKRLILALMRGLIRRSSEPYWTVPSLGGLRCAQANSVCTDEQGSVLFHSVLHPLR